MHRISRSFAGETVFAPFAPLHVTLLASPRRTVQAGGTLSLTLVLINCSSETVCDVNLAVPVPFGTSFVERTLFHDAVRIDGTRFFGEGCEIARLEPAARTAFIWKLRVESGEEPIRIVPQIWAGTTRALGTEPIHVSRQTNCLEHEAASSYREFARAARGYFEYIFRRPAPASLRQALFACALACALDGAGGDAGLARQAQALNRLARAARGQDISEEQTGFLMELRGLRDARIAAATLEGLRAFAALDAAARDLAADDGVCDTLPLA
ncbi:MAG TPA: hypothetical protein VMV82_00455 [Candidatus Dormibacteraeota bacterium]|nr:hypothetical protein [Candidatus Dormibacteraeota bacterium]